MEPGDHGAGEPRQALNPDVLRSVVQRRVSLRSAMTSLEVSLAARSSGRTLDWRVRVAMSLHGLGECMNNHIASTEGPGGFHEQIVSAAPRLARSVTISVTEHRKICDLIAAVQTAVNRESEDADADVDEVRESGTRLVALVARHRQRGADMVYEAYQTDLGGGD
jgi:hypothetical protein